MQVQIYTVNIETLIKSYDPDNFLNLVSPQKQKIIKSTPFKAVAWRHLIGEILTKYIFTQKLGLISNELALITNEHGKPKLKNFPDIHFNLSHSGIWVAITIHDHPVGIDVEHIRPLSSASKIAKRFFSPLEQNYLNNIAQDQYLGSFFKLWTLKESYIKAIGKGLSYSLSSFNIDITDQETVKLIDPKNNKAWNFQSFDLKHSYSLAVCSTSTVKNKKIIEIQPNTLLDFYYAPP
ncbi:4'-phosphopantetheinyl transferase family protein [Candidatus Margulisiibacteriota bacterium]